MSEESIKKAKPFIVEFAKRNNISEDAAMLFAAFFNDFADHQIWIRDVAGFFECNKVKILTMWSAIEELVRRRFILQYKKGSGDLYFTVPNEVVAAMREDRIYSPSANADLTIDKWLSMLSRLLNDRDNDNIPYANFVEDLHVLINSNKHLVIARELATIKDDEHLVIFAGIMDLYIRNNDNHIIRTDLEKDVRDILVSCSKLSDLWKEADLETKQRIQKLLFPEDIFWDKENRHYRTENRNPIYDVFDEISVSYGHKKETDSEEPVSSCVG